jgi:hypothetical protein
LKLLNAKGVEYLLVGGYAVNLHGYPRATGDMDVWIARHPENAAKMVDTLQEFGFAVDGLSADLFLKEDSIIRLGVPPLRIEVHTDISGVDFQECYHNRTKSTLDDVSIDLIDLDHLKRNKKASGRPKDISDLDYLS